MGIFSGLFKSRDKPQNHTSGSNYAFFIGGTTSGKAVTERSAMQMTAVYSCVRILAEAVAGLPLNLYRYTEDGGAAPYDYTAADNALDDLPGAPENYELLDMDDFLPAEPAEMKPTIQRIRRST